MFGACDWRKLIHEAVDAVADSAYQRRAWFGDQLSAASPAQREVSSPDEEINRLFSDLDFEDFLESQSVILTANQRQLGVDLRDAMLAFIEGTPTVLDAHKVFDDPRWGNIRSLAAKFSAALGSSE